MAYKNEQKKRHNDLNTHITFQKIKKKTKKHAHVDKQAFEITGEFSRGSNFKQDLRFSQLIYTSVDFNRLSGLYFSQACVEIGMKRTHTRAALGRATYSDTRGCLTGKSSTFNAN